MAETAPAPAPEAPVQATSAVDANTPKKKSNVLLWVLGGCGGCLVIIVIGIILLSVGVFKGLNDLDLTDLEGSLDKIDTSDLYDDSQDSELNLDSEVEDEEHGDEYGVREDLLDILCDPSTIDLGDVYDETSEQFKEATTFAEFKSVYEEFELVFSSCSDNDRFYNSCMIQGINFGEYAVQSELNFFVASVADGKLLSIDIYEGSATDAPSQCADLAGS